MDKLQAMSMFVKIADCGSLTSAAQALGKSLPAVVRNLAALEAELNVRLLNRTTRQIALTEEGRLYLEHSRKILDDIQQTERLLSNNQTEPSGTITVTAPVRFGEMHVLPAITRFLTQHTHVKINLLLLDRVVNLLDEGIDIAVRIAHLNDSSLIAKHIGEIRQIVCASPELLKKYGEPQHPESLVSLPCIQFTGISAGSAWQFQEKTKKLSIKISGNFTCNHIGASVNACLYGLGFGHFYSYQVMPYIENRQLDIVLTEYEPPPQPVSLVFQNNLLTSLRFRLFADWLTRELRSTLKEKSIG